MSCVEFRARLHPYVDGELPVHEMADAEAHATECPRCAELTRRERAFRELLRRQPRESAPAELRAAVTARVRREARRSGRLRWLVAPAVAAAAAAVLVSVLLPAGQPSSPLIGELVDKHIAYAQVERPAELPSADGGEVEAWFRDRAGLRVVVPDFSPAGIHLVGARLAEARERKAAYLLYEKGRTLLSVFMVPADVPDADLRGAKVSFRGHEYVKGERKGFRTVAWTERRAVFGLVSMLDYDALLECADRLRAERASRTRL